MTQKVASVFNFKVSLTACNDTHRLGYKAVAFAVGVAGAHTCRDMHVRGGCGAWRQAWVHGGRRWWVHGGAAVMYGGCACLRATGVTLGGGG